MNSTTRFLLLLIPLLLAACGRVTDLAYNNAPRFVASEFEEAFALTPMQNDQLGGRLAAFFDWHRKEELARYSQVLDQAAMAAADGISANELLDLRDQVFAARDRALVKAIDSLGDLASGLSPAQIESFDNYHQENSEEYVEYLQNSERQRESFRVRRAFARLERWFGQIDDALGKRIRDRLRDVPDVYQAWIDYREQRHQALLAELRAVPDRGFDHERLKTILLDPETEHARAFAPAREDYWRGYAAALEDISSWLDERQLQRLVSRLQDYARAAARLRDAG